MRTYVTSLHGRAFKAHIGTDDWTACGAKYRTTVEVTTEIPPGYVLCALCASAHDARALGFTVERRDRVLALLCEGYRDDEVALRLDMGLRTVTRHVAFAQQEWGAATRMQLGYMRGLADHD